MDNHKCLGAGRTVEVVALSESVSDAAFRLTTDSGALSLALGIDQEHLR